MHPFPEYACAYAKKLAASSPRFALQISAKGEDADMAGATEPGATESACGERGGAFPRSADPFGELAQKPCPGLTQRFPDRVQRDRRQYFWSAVLIGIGIMAQNKPIAIARDTECRLRCQRLGS